MSIKNKTQKSSKNTGPTGGSQPPPHPRPLGFSLQTSQLTVLCRGHHRSWCHSLRPHGGLLDPTRHANPSPALWWAEHLLGGGLGDTEGTGRSPAPQQLGTGEHGIRAPSPGPDALTAWVARGGGTSITALGVGEHCRQRKTELNGIAGSDLF